MITAIYLAALFVLSDQRRRRRYTGRHHTWSDPQWSAAIRRMRRPCPA